MCLSVFRRSTFTSSPKPTGPTSTKLGTKRHFVKGSQFFSNEGSDPIFPIGDNNEIANMHWRNLKKKHLAN